MNWADIQLFEAAASSGSLTAGARALGLSQPQMSRRLKELERRMGVRLFDRTPQGLRPTTAGRKLIPLAAQMRLVADAVDRVRPQLSGTTLNVVRVSVDEIREYFLVQHLDELITALSGLEIEVFSGHEHPDHTSRQTDVQIRSCLPDSGSLIAKRLGYTRFALYATEDFVSSIGTDPAKEIIQHSDWIGIAPDHLWYPEQKRWLDEFFLRPSKLRFNTMVGILNAARAGAGIALLPRFMADLHPELVRLNGSDDPLQTVEYLIVHRDLLQEPAIRRTIDAVAALFKKYLLMDQRQVTPGKSKTGTIQDSGKRRRLQKER